VQPLPIDPHLGTIAEALHSRGALVLVADPGAGKTTRVPRALLEGGLADAGEVLVLEPRRLAARMAARRVAEELGERVGEQVGYQVRFEDVGGPRTRIRFLTEGILTRRLASDGRLHGVSAVLLDEFHERHLHADLALAVLRRLQEGPRPDLKIAVMSATLDAEPVARFLGCEVLRVPGRRFEVTIQHLERADGRPLHTQVASAIRKLAQAGPEGDILVFLPGAAEIRRAHEACGPVAALAGLEIALLHGDLPAAEQDRAVRPGPRPKLILSTNVAETSITIEGVVAVVDSGLARVARHSPWSGLPSLEVARVSRASAAQRAGRAGRTQPGRCLRLYTRHDHDTRPEHDPPEVRRADLAEAVLSLRAMGERDPARFPWFEPPPAAALEAADRLLARLGAVTEDGSLTDLGRRMLVFPLHPRLSRLVLEADARGAGRRGCLLAALVGEREIRLAARARLPGRPALVDTSGPSDLLARMDAFLDAERASFAPERLRALGLDVGSTLAVARAREQIARALGPRDHGGDDEALLLATLAGFPDRVARRRQRGSPDVVFAGGGAARLAETCVVRDADLLVAVEAEEQRGRTVVRAASAAEPEWLLVLCADRIVEGRELRYNATRERVEEARSVLYDGLVLEESLRLDVSGPEAARLLADAALATGPGRLCDPEELERWRNRLDFAAAHAGGLPSIDDASLREAIVASCEGRRSLAEIREVGLLDLLRSRLTAAQRALVDRLAPERVTLPGGRSVRVEYERGQPPWIASRLQDFFGMRQGPAVAGGRVPLLLHLLAPNQRAVQVTTDLAGFWERHYPTVRRELMRRYPKHAWPEDPRAARPPLRRRPS
jgi:ATP-dependent helicase HrpB